MKTIKEYAEEKNVSYEAVRKQISRYAAELDQHIILKKRKKYLDDEAIKFLDERRKENPVIVVNENHDEERKRLQKENDSLKNQLLENQQRFIALLEENSKYKAIESKMELMIEQQIDVEIEREQLQKELESFKPSLFGLYKKVEVSGNKFNKEILRQAKRNAYMKNDEV